MNFLAGVDEVGRGSIAGPVTAAAVILKNTNDIIGLTDSKALSSKRRQELDILIKEKSISWNIAFVSATTIDRINILQASLLAMKRAVERLGMEPDKVLVDGLYKPDLSNPSEAIVKGDTKHASIMAASIIAKVARDKYMIKLHKKFPHYGFKSHKGYPTKFHLNALELHGPCKEHRKSFKPLRDRIY